MTMIQNDIALSGTQFLYDQPEALHSGVHGGLKFVADAAPFAKAEGVHIVPLLVGEFVQAMMHYPIVFGGPERTPMAIMGLKAGQNMFVKDGRFEDGAYVPAYLRRYPFTLAGAGSEDFVVCIDRDAPGFVEGEEGQPLFEGEQPTDFTRNAIAFLNEFEVERKRTQAFVELLVEADVLEVKHTMFIAAATGERELIADYYAVSEEKLRELGDDKLAEMVKRGAMSAVDAHLMSLQRWDALIARRDVAAGPAAPDAETATADDVIDA
ncbi:MAG: SapC family protein [Methylobacterium sp.]